MTLEQFKRALAKAKPPAGLAPALAALWWAGKGEWDKAHGIVMNDDGRDAAWVHAYLHRVEGDLGNAGYWYRQARRAAASGSIEAEWDAIATALIDQETRTP
jgi:hypothetical protein